MSCSNPYSFVIDKMSLKYGSRKHPGTSKVKITPRSHPDGVHLHPPTHTSTRPRTHLWPDARCIHRQRQK